ncbi:MAG: hypothetical protein FD129_385 [bacterium]|nr:MAG: hypothetical protein FD129_385 [bacterium]
MKMKYRLSGIGARVHDDPVAPGRQAQLPGESPGEEAKPAEESPIGRPQVVESREMPAWNEEEVNRRLRLYVLEGHEFVVREDDPGRDAAVGDPAEQARFHGENVALPPAGTKKIRVAASVIIRGSVEGRTFQLIESKSCPEGIRT